MEDIAEIKLTPKQQRFVEEYMIDLNATQAAIRAGYSPDTAQEQSSRLLSNVMVSRAVEIAKAEIAAKAAVSAEMVLAGLKDVAQRCLQAKPVIVYDKAKRAYVPATDEEGNAIYEFDSQGANRAFELIGKHIGMFVDKKEIQVTAGQLDVSKMSDDEIKRELERQNKIAEQTIDIDL